MLENNKSMYPWDTDTQHAECTLLQKQQTNNAVQCKCRFKHI